jgi:Rieske Fe-S protein
MTAPTRPQHRDEAPDAVEATPDTPSTALSRRHVLAAAGAVGAAGVLAACSSSNPTDAVDAARSAASQAASAAQSAASQAASAVSSAADKIASAADIPVNGGKVIEQAKVVITQPEAGTFKAFTAVCPHQGCLVNEVVDNVINCPCHGSQFSASDGSVIKGPATEGLAAAGINVNGEDISVG